MQPPSGDLGDAQLCVDGSSALRGGALVGQFLYPHPPLLPVEVRRCMFLLSKDVSTLFLRTRAFPQAGPEETDRDREATRDDNNHNYY